MRRQILDWLAWLFVFDRMNYPPNAIRVPSCHILNSKLRYAFVRFRQPPEFLYVLVVHVCRVTEPREKVHKAHGVAWFACTGLLWRCLLT